MHIRFGCLLIFTAAFFLTIACKDKKPADPSGTWLKDSQSAQIQDIGTLELKENSLFYFTASSPDHSDSQGKYSLRDNEITFEDDTCYNAGTYQYTISKKELTFIVVSDSCEGRSKVLGGVWIQQR